MVDGLVGRKLLREQAPLAAAPQHVEDGINHIPPNYVVTPRHPS
jgi:hypothetical protein